MASNERPPEDGTEEEEVEDPKAYLTPTFFYDDKQLYEESHARTPFDEKFKLQHIFGFDVARRYNSKPLDDKTLIITVGNFAYLLDIITGNESIINGHNEGVTCCAVHPNNEYVALGEAGKNPDLLIYQCPSLKLYRILKGGTESAYTTLNFSPDGKMLAAVGTFPDYTLTVWDWEKETLILRAKAFSQDIYRVIFSQNLAGRLCTGGVGHIRFWEMARTFTGLKLQGEIGKFGNIEISDTAGFAMFPDGKVLSGSESGSLLLWEDALVKCEFARQGGKKCHKGMVEIVFKNGNDIITAGRDGVIRIWDFQTIDTAETEDTSVAIDLTQKFKIKLENGSIRCMHQTTGNKFYIVDSNGAIWLIDLDEKDKKFEPMLKYHSGAVRAAAFSPKDPIFVTGGDDGYVRLWAITDKTMIGELKFDAGVTKIFWMPKDFDEEAITIIVGFADGCLRVLICTAEGLKLKQPLKPHTGAVRDIVPSPTSKMMATTADDGALFFFKLDKDLVPLGFVYVNGKKPRTKEEITQAAISGITLEDDREYAKGIRIRWSQVVSVECSDGTVASVNAPTMFATENNESYYLELPIETINSTVQEDSITAILNTDEGDFIGKNDGTIVTDKFSKKLHSAPITIIAATSELDYLLTGSENGEIYLFKQTLETRARSIEEKIELKPIEVPQIEDIKAGDYSIEEEKQKSELDRRIRAADQKKEIKRQHIENLRQKYSALVQKNSKVPSYMRLSQQDFKIDPFLYDLMQEKSDELVKEASTSTMWQAEKSRVGLRKVKERLVRNMAEESFSIRAIGTDVKVSSFRITALDPDVAKVLNEQQNSQTESSETEAAADDTTHQSESATIVETETVASVQSSVGNRKRKANRFNQQAPMKKITHTPDEHTLLRKKRDERSKAIMELKPPANYSDPADLHAIEVARNTIGDYKLKDDPKYIAPEEDRMNASKKRKQLMLLQNAIQDMKLQFNSKLKDLQQLKVKLINSINETNRQLSEIELTIGKNPNDEPYVSIKKDETTPLLDLTEKINISLPTPEAISFAEHVAAAAKRRLEAQAGKQKQTAQPARRGATKRQQVHQTKKKAEAKEQPSEIEVIEQNEIKAELEYKRKLLIQNIKQAIEKFDSKITAACEEKVRVHSEIVLAELRFLVMLREFKLLAKLELKDHELNDKLKQRQHDMDSIDREVAMQQKELKQQEHEVEEDQKELKKLNRKFDNLVDPSTKFHDQLFRIFGYNIRRNAKKNEGDEIEVDLSTLDVEAVRKMFEAQSMEKEEDTCPVGCDPALFEKVLDLRELKMDIVEKIQNAQSQKDKIKTQCDLIQNRRKGLETQFNQIKQEFEDFQHQKQKHLNELNFSLSLQFHQIQNLVAQEIQVGESRAPQVVKSMPKDLKDSLVFTNSGLYKMRQQEANLRAESKTLATMQKTNIAKQTEDTKTRNDLKNQITDTTSKLNGIQKLKFGQTVDLVQLEQLRVNHEADALSLQIKNIEKQQNDEMDSIQENIQEMTDALTAEVQRNTAVLGSLASLTEQQRDIESVLQNSRTTQSADDLNQDLELANPADLLQEVEKNNELIDALNEEIALLKRK